MKAYSLIRPQPWYRREAFETGLKAAGYEVINGTPAHPEPDDVLLIWNRYGDKHEIANRFEAAGAKVLVAENGYLGKGGSTPKFDVHPHGPGPDDYYALAIGGHNGSGRWPAGSAKRWDALEIDLKPWCRGGKYVLVCPSRPFGSPEMTMPFDWVNQIVKIHRSLSTLPVVVRDHPGNDRPKRPIAADLVDAESVVIWASSAGLHASLAGVPVFVSAPHWILMPEETLDSMVMPGDLQAFHRLASAQWTVREIESGEPFEALKAVA